MSFQKIISKIILFGATGVFFVGCKPKEYIPDGLSSISVTNVAPGSPTVDVLVDGLVRSQTRLNYGSTTVSVPGASTYYLSIYEGQHNIKVSTDTAKTNSLIDVNDNFEQGRAYTYVVTDTVLNGKLKAVRLVDDLTVPATGQVKFRAIHAAPTTGAVDVTFLRASGPDSVTISNLSYIANISNPDITALSKFVSGPAGSYTIKVKQAGTQTVVLSATSTLTAGRIYTFFVRGGAKSVPLSIGSLANY